MMTEAEKAELLSERILNAIYSVTDEWDITLATICGCMDCVKFQLIREQQDAEDE